MIVSPLKVTAILGNKNGITTAIILKSVKGKGVSFMENNASWHGSAPNEEQYNQAIAELDAKIAELEASL